ncbi:Ribonuclease VapC [Tumidithrix helvetica PCC 7403]|uniref:type II toxin-antitoxin system VapC family toxin n=1 Tax=Tumidithrix helvetica TaxID=3457545 RepID=UPI003CADF53B
MSGQIFIDTLFVVALVNPRDQYHHIAKQFSEQLENEQFLTTEAILLEVGNALSRNYRSKAIEIIEYFYSSPEVEIVSLTPELFRLAFALYKKHQDKEWGLVDCISFIVMQEKKSSKALTFDRHFSQAGFQSLMRDNG